MKALDTNVLVRYVVEDDPTQHRQAARLIEDAQTKKEPLFLSLVVLCETVWVLENHYRLPPAMVAAVLEQLLHADAFVIERPDVAVHGLDRYRKSRGDFADYVIGAVAQQAGCSTTYTFDRSLRGEAGFHVL